MAKYKVSLKYGNPGQPQNTTTTVDVEASSESTAMTLAINKFKTSNGSTYLNRDVSVVKVVER